MDVVPLKHIDDETHATNHMTNEKWNLGYIQESGYGI